MLFIKELTRLDTEQLSSVKKVKEGLKIQLTNETNLEKAVKIIHLLQPFRKRVRVSSGGPTLSCFLGSLRLIILCIP